MQLTHVHDMLFELGGYETLVAQAVAASRQACVAGRMWERDHTLWKGQPDEISNRLGWLDAVETMRTAIPDIKDLVAWLQQAGITHALLLGMGGSSLAPEVFARTFGVKSGYLDLRVLDSTDPAVVLGHLERLQDQLDKCVFIVSTKSGGTVETLSFFKYFYNQVVEKLGRERAGAHFIAITDPGSSLGELAQAYRFKTTIFNDPNIGGRYSALSYFGLLPAALLGVDLCHILERAQLIVDRCRIRSPQEPEQNPALVLGAALAALALAGRDKLTLQLSPPIASFASWVEQLIAESTGKQGKGILPVVGEQFAEMDVYGDDRLFVFLQVRGDQSQQAQMQALKAAGHPLITIRLEDVFDLGGQFFLWEFATAVAGYHLGIQPFDQPDVESAKQLARQMMVQFQQSGDLPVEPAQLETQTMRVYSDWPVKTPQQALLAALAITQPGDYIALQAYLPPGDGMDAALAQLRLALRQRSCLAVTSGYGPRFLHSTGQLHKGDAGKGLFIQLTADIPRDVAIPDEAGEQGSSTSFGVLLHAQASGDSQALRERGRKVLRLHFKDQPVEQIKILAQEL